MDFRSIHYSIVRAGQVALAIFLSSQGLNAATINFKLDRFELAISGGGIFDATVAGDPEHTVYCVDLQLTAAFGVEYTGYRTSLRTDLFNPGEARYSGVSGIGGNSPTKWAHDVGIGSPGAPSEALTRYRMAAYLTTRYDLANPGSVDNQALQRAVWLMLDTGAVTQSSAGLEALVQDARNFVAAAPTSTWNNFFLLSGWRAGQATGLADSGAGQVQTFIEFDDSFGGGTPGSVPSEIPEPSMGILLGTGGALLGIARAVRRRRIGGSS
jgi:hypothetical protein